MKTGYRQSPGSNCPRRGAAMARHGRRPSPAPAARPVRFFYETRDTAFMLFTNHETRNTDFVAVVFAVGAQGTHNQEPPPGLPPPPPGRCFPARCGAAWGGYGAAWAAAVPRSATRPVGLSPATNHATCFPPALRRLQGEQLQARPTGFSRITNHETRITAFFRITAFIRLDALPTSLYFSPRGEAKCVRGASGRGARRLARAGVLEQYVEHGKQAQRSPGGRIACFDRRVVRNAG